MLGLPRRFASRQTFLVSDPRSTSVAMLLIPFSFSITVSARRSLSSGIFHIHDTLPGLHLLCQFNFVCVTAADFADFAKLRCTGSSTLSCLLAEPDHFSLYPFNQVDIIISRPPNTDWGHLSFASMETRTFFHLIHTSLKNRWSPWAPDVPFFPVPLFVFQPLLCSFHRCYPFSFSFMSFYFVLIIRRFSAFSNFLLVYWFMIVKIDWSWLWTSILFSWFFN